jgi:hypothetical protein
MPDTHQVTTTVLTRTDQIPRGLLTLGRDRRGRELTQPEQASQMGGVLGVNLDPMTRGPLQLRRRHDRTADPCRGQRPKQSEAGRTDLRSDRHRTWKLTQPRRDVGV